MIWWSTEQGRDDINVMLDLYVDFMIIVAIIVLMLKGLLSAIITDPMTVREAGMLFSHISSPGPGFTQTLSLWFTTMDTGNVW